MINDELNVFRGIFKAPMFIYILLLETILQACSPLPLEYYGAHEKACRAGPRRVGTCALHCGLFGGGVPVWYIIACHHRQMEEDLRRS